MNNSKYFFTIISLLALIVFFVQSCSEPEIVEKPKIKEFSKINNEQVNNEKTDGNNFPKVKNLTDFPNTEFLPTLEHPLSKDKNGIYAASLLYCWDEIKKAVGEPIVIDKKFADLTLVNNSKSHLNVLKPNEYTSSVEFEGQNIKAKAEFKKSLPLEVKLKEFSNYLKFDNVKVQSFGINYYAVEMLKAFRILYYQDDDNFIIKLNPDDNEHEIILFKSNFGAMKTIKETIIATDEKIEIGKKEKLQKDLNWKYHFQAGDNLVIPKFKFNLENDFLNLVGSNFSGKSGGYLILKAYQRTAFLIDHNGAEVESEAKIVVMKSEESDKPIQKFKTMKFDKPFLLLMKRVDNKNPYFAMWVANAELMEKEE